MSQVKVEEQIGGVIVHLRGQFIGGEETDALRDILKKYAEEQKNKLIIDFEKATYLNSTALGVLIAAHSNFAKRGGEIILCNLDKSLENIFMITKLITVFNVADDLQSAIKML